jgi:hypothetical protein
MCMRNIERTVKPRGGANDFEKAKPGKARVG